MKVEPVRPCVYLDIKIGGRNTGRVVIELYEHQAPRTCAWFLESITNNIYTGARFGKAIKNFMVQSAIEEHSGDPAPAAIENSQCELNTPFQVCAVDDASGNFFVTTFPQPHLQGKQTVFGQVIHGKFVVRQMERVKTASTGAPLETIQIAATGEWTEDMDVPVEGASYDRRGGDIYEEYPDDDTNIDKESTELVFNAACAIKESGTLLYKSGDAQSAFYKYRKCLRYVMEYIPDIDQHPEWYQKYTDLKTKLYLNLALTALSLHQWETAVQYASYIIDTPTIDAPTRAKGYFRRAKARVGSRKFDEALVDFQLAHSLLPQDKAIAAEVDATEGLLQQKKAAEKAKYAKFFQ